MKNHSIYDIRQYDTIRSFRYNIYTNSTSMDEAEMDRTNLLKNWNEFSEKSKPRTKKNFFLKV